LLAVVLLISDRHPSAHRVDRNLHRVRKRRAALDHVIGQEPEPCALSKDRRLVLDRAVLEMKSQATRHAVAVGRLDEVPARQEGAVERPKNEEAADEPLRVAHGDRFGRQSTGDKETGQKDCRDRAPFHGRGTLPPAPRASDKPMAIACLRLVTVFPEPPDFNSPLFISWSALPTFSEGLA